MSFDPLRSAAVAGHEEERLSLHGKPCWSPKQRAVVQSRYALRPELRPTDDDIYRVLLRHSAMAERAEIMDMREMNIPCSNGETLTLPALCKSLLEQLPMTAAGYCGRGPPSHAILFRRIEIDGVAYAIKFEVSNYHSYSVTFEGLSTAEGGAVESCGTDENSHILWFLDNTDGTFLLPDDAEKWLRQHIRAGHGPPGGPVVQ